MGRFIFILIAVAAAAGILFIQIISPSKIEPLPSPADQRPPTPLPPEPSPPSQPAPPPSLPTPVPPSCKIGGCSDQLCLQSDEDVITTCEYRPEYQCYKNARCERQPDGHCGWTPTPALTACFQKFKQGSSPPTSDEPSPTISSVPSPTILPAPSPAADKVSSLTVSYDDGFTPSSLTIAQGQTVIFVNKSRQSMWPASDPHPAHNLYPEKDGCAGSAFDSCRGVLAGESWSLQFQAAGSWPYHNHLKPIERGVINVR